MELLRNIISNLEHWLIDLSNVLPTEVFVVVGSFVEEIIAPIPSPLVMTVAGGLAEAQQRGFLYLVFIGIVASIVKTFAQWLFYVFADKSEDITTSKLGKISGFSHKDIENIGKHFSGGIKDDVVLVIARALPILPAAVVSLVAGFIKLDMKTYIRASLIGNFLRSILFLYIGYTGLASYESLSEGVETFEDVARLSLLILAIVAVGAVLLFRKRFKRHH